MATETPTIIGITSMPNRKSKYLYIQEDSVFRAVARFYHDHEAEEFLEILKRHMPVLREDDEDDASSALQRAYDVRD